MIKTQFDCDLVWNFCPRLPKLSYLHPKNKTFNVSFYLARFLHRHISIIKGIQSFVLLALNLGIKVNLLLIFILLRPMKTIFLTGFYTTPESRKICSPWVFIVATESFFVCSQTLLRKRSSHSSCLGQEWQCIIVTFPFVIAVWETSLTTHPMLPKKNYLHL